MRDAVAHFAWNGQVGHRARTIGKLVHTSHGPAAFDWPMHDHDFYEITIVVEGSAVHHSDYGLWEVRRGNALFIKPGSWHACRRCKDLVVINACFPADLIKGELGPTVRADPAVRALLTQTGDYGIVAVQLGAQSTRSCETALRALHDDLQSEGLRSRVIGRLLLVLGILGGHLDTDALMQMDRALLVRPWLTAAAALLRERYREPWRLDQLAAQVAVTPNHLARSFKATFGLAPMSYLTGVRAEVAATLLLQTDQPIAAIGAEVGWPDPNYFARRFRAHVGASPSAYRAAYATDHADTSARSPGAVADPQRSC